MTGAAPDPAGVVVIGGGLAGISAAVRLADAGRRVALLEARPRLGGATYSFDRDGLAVDTGQHVFLRCYRDYRRLLERIGTAGQAPVQDRLDVPVLLPGGGRARLRRGRHGPAPLHLVPALAGYRALPLGARLSVLRAGAALRRVDPDDPRTDQQTFGDWLARHGQGAAADRAVWRLLTVAALNLDPEHASLALAARVFRTALLDAVGAGDIGVPRATLERLHGAAAVRLLGRLGVEVHTGQRVRAIEADEVAGPDRLTVRTDTGELAASGVVVAVPHRSAAVLVPEPAVPGRERWAGLGSAPIVNVHLWFDRPVLDSGFAAVLDPELQWLFDRTTGAGADRGQYLVSSLSGADRWVRTPAGRLRDAQLAALRRVLPRTAGARLLDGFVTREPHATFRQQAGTAALRPHPATRWPGLVLAGAWTATGLPDTMEGAVRSGNRAADSLLGRTSRAQTRGRRPDSADDPEKEMIA